MSGEPPREPRAALCARHGLRFDPATQSGCVLCRREQGAPAPGAAPGVPAAPATIEAVVPGWLVAALIWLVAGAALFSLHERVLGVFGGLLPAAQEERLLEDDLP